MSLAAMQKVWDEADCSGGELLVLLCLADHVGSDEKMIAWPSIALIAKRARMSERGAQKALRRLMHKGLISVKEGGGRSGTNRYVLHIPEQTELELPDEKPRTPVQGEQSSGGEQSAGEQSSEGVNFEAKNPEPRFTRTQRTQSYYTPDSKRSVLAILSEVVAEDQASAFWSHRMALRKKLTDRAARLVIRNLRSIEARGGDGVRALDLAIERGWLTCEPEWFFKAVANGSVPEKPREGPPEGMSAERWTELREQARQRKKEWEH